MVTVLCHHGNSIYTGTQISEIDIESRDGSGDKVTRTVITSNIALEELLCYKVSYNFTNRDGTKTKRTVST